MKLATTAVFATLVAAAPAFAQPAEQPAPATDGKDPTTALVLSLGGTLASAGLMAYGLQRINSGHDDNGVTLLDIGLVSSLITPSLGHFYAGEIMSTGLVIRGAGAAVALYGVSQALGCLGDEESDCNDGETALVIGAGVFAAGAIWDIVDAPRAANRWNLKHVQIAPVPVGSGASVGLGISGQF